MTVKEYVDTLQPEIIGNDLNIRYYGEDTLCWSNRVFYNKQDVTDMNYVEFVLQERRL